MTEKHILIVEHDPIRGKTLDLVLTEVAGYQTTLATTPSEAFEVIANKQVDLILANTSLERRQDGVLMARTILIRLKTAAPPMMMLTSENDHATVARCVQVGVMGLVVQPFDPPMLLQRIQKILSDRKGFASELESNLRKTLAAIIDLPTISPVYTKIQAVSSTGDGSDVSSDEIEQIMRLDQAITAKVLRMANSAFFGFNRHITSVKDAAALLGFAAIQHIVLTVATFEAVQDLKMTRGFSLTSFWTHCIAVGTVASEIARRLDRDHETAFVAGLLHDVGKVVLASHYTETFGAALSKANRENLPIYEAEGELIHLTHAEVGRFLAEKWDLPEPLPGAIGDHHDLESSREEDRETVCLVHVADCVCRGLKIGSGGDEHVPLIQREALDYLDIENEQIETWSVEVRPEIEKALSLLELI